ncbi:MAG: radical SAM protein, partial [Thaumarchaeota archaeon]
MLGKVLPFKPDDWPDMVGQAFGICEDSYWVPCATLILGLLGETENAVIKTIELMDRLRNFKSLIIPLFFVPLGALKGERPFGMDKMNRYHW